MAVLADRLAGAPVWNALRYLAFEGRPPVGLVQCDAYEPRTLRAALESGLSLVPPPDLRGRRVVLKPNFVEFHEGRPINTDVRLIQEVVGLFRDLGATDLVVAEGPGHYADTDDAWARSGLVSASSSHGFRLVDLNYDDLVPVGLATYTAKADPKPPKSLLGQLYLPKTIHGADVLVSMPKLKTHHWAGCTLGMKNLFGVIPGSKYGWPKNLLHYNHISRSIVELAANVPVHYAIVDGVVGMEGDGPILGTPIDSKCLIFGRSVFDVDRIAAQAMGFDPAKIEYMRFAAFLGLFDEEDPRVAGVPLREVRKQFRTLPQFDGMKA